MGIDIGVCKYDAEREFSMARHEILSNLPGDEGEESKEIYSKLWHSCTKEFTYKMAQESGLDCLSIVGARMHNLDYSIRLHYTEISFHFFDTFTYDRKKVRVYRVSLQAVAEDMERVLKLVDDFYEREWFKKRILFYRYIIDNDLMIYSC